MDLERSESESREGDRDGGPGATSRGPVRRDYGTIGRRSQAAGTGRTEWSGDASSERSGTHDAPVQRYTAGGRTYRIERLQPAETVDLLAAVRAAGCDLPGDGTFSGGSAPPRARDARAADRCSFAATAAAPEGIVGWSHVAGAANPGHVPTAGVALTVRERHRGRGLGTRLLVRCVGWAAAEGYDRLYTVVPAERESAIAFLRSRGWKLKSYRVEDHSVEAAVMEVEV